MAITAKDIHDLVRSNMEDRTIAEALKPVLAKFEGKKITKAIMTAVKKEFPDWNVSYDASFGMFHVTMWQKVWNDRVRYLLGYDTDPIFRMENFLARNVWAYAAAEERNMIREAELANDAWAAKVATAINTMNLAKRELEDLLEYPCPDVYSIKDLLEK